MTYFLHDAPLEAGARVELRGEEAHHLLRVRRIRTGERFALQDSQGRRFEAELVAGERRGATVAVLAPLPVPPAPAVRVTLLQAAVKEKSAELIIEKATELGVAALCFFPSEHGTVAQQALHSPHLQARWERIAWEACKQCDRQFPPELLLAAGLQAALSTHGVDPQRQVRGWVLHPGAAVTPAETLRAAPPTALHLLIGPEGGLSEAEVAAATAAGYTPVRLGGTILRAETAAVAACAIAVLGT